MQRVQQQLRQDNLADRGDGIHCRIPDVRQIVISLLDREAEHGRLRLQASQHTDQQQLQADARANTNPELAPLYADLDLYLAVPLALLSGAPAHSPNAARYVDLIQAANGFARGMLSPVSMASTIDEWPSITWPSTGTLSPGLNLIVA